MKEGGQGRELSGSGTQVLHEDEIKANEMQKLLIRMRWHTKENYQGP